MGLARLSLLKHQIPKSTFQSLKTLSEPKPTSNLSLNFPLNIRGYHRRSGNNSLYSKITLFVAGSPDGSLIPFLEQWVRQGNEARPDELQRIIRALRSKKRFARALEVSEWMTRSDGHFFPGDCAKQLDLIGKVHGIDAAERYFNEVDFQSEKMYGALLNCYVTECLVDKSHALLKKMEDLGLAKHSLTYNGIMSLHFDTNQLEKVPQVLEEMQENGVTPDNVSYRLCIKSYGLRSDFTSIENLVHKMESQPHFTIEWSTYTAVASHYIQGGLHDKATYYLQKAEERVNKKALGYNNLITLYGSLGDLSQMMRLWQKKSTCTHHSNLDYMTFMGSLVKLGKFEEAERVFKEWEASGNLYDFRVPNALLIGYTQQGLVDKAVKMLEGIISKGKNPTPNSWSIISSGYAGMKNMEKTIWCMKRALELGPQHRGWEPKPKLVSEILNWLAVKGDIEEIEEVLDLLGRVVNKKDQEIYHNLLRAKVRHGQEIERVRN